MVLTLVFVYANIKLIKLPLKELTNERADKESLRLVKANESYCSCLLWRHR